MINRIKLVAWVATGTFLNQLLHSIAYRQGGGVSSILSFKVEYKLAMLSAFVLFIVSFAILFFAFARMSRKPHFIVFPFLIIESLSQICGVSIIKLGFDIGILQSLYSRAQIAIANRTACHYWEGCLSNIT